MNTGQVVVIGADVEAVYEWIESKQLDIDDVRVVVTPDQVKGLHVRYIVFVPGWTKNKRLGEILEMLLDIDRG